MLANNERDQLAARAHQGWPFWQFSRDERRLGPVARALLGDAAADLEVRRRRLRPHRGRGELRGTGRQERRARHRSLDRGQTQESRAGRRSENSQAVYRRDQYASPRVRRGPYAARARGDRLLVRLGRDALCPVGLSGKRRRAEQFQSKNFPADFISEAIDQTRGWFYSQLAISTLVFGPKTGAEKPPRRSRRGDVRQKSPIPTPSATASCWA